MSGMFNRMLLLLTGVFLVILRTHMWVLCRGQHAMCMRLSGVFKGHIHTFMHSVCVETRWVKTGRCIMNCNSITHIYKYIWTNVCFRILSYWHLKFQLDFLNRQLKLIPWTLTNLAVHVGKCVSASVNLRVSLCDDKTQESKYYSTVRD